MQPKRIRHHCRRRYAKRLIHLWAYSIIHRNLHGTNPALPLLTDWIVTLKVGSLTFSGHVTPHSVSVWTKLSEAAGVWSFRLCNRCIIHMDKLWSGRPYHVWVEIRSVLCIWRWTWLFKAAGMFYDMRSLTPSRELNQSTKLHACFKCHPSFLKHTIQEVISHALYHILMISFPRHLSSTSRLKSSDSV